MGGGMAMTGRRGFLGLAAAAATMAQGELEWNTPAPRDCPAPPSKDFKGLVFTGRHAEYTKADTWYPSWASDGNLYSPWTDGSVDDVRCSSGGVKAQTGSAKIAGDDPLALRVLEPRTYPGDPAPYGGRYPCGSLVYEGVWHYGTYCLNDSEGDAGKGLNWDILGPFVGFRHSTDYGKTWTDTPHTPASPLFGEPASVNGPVKIGAPHFVDFGRNMEHSPDGKAYLVAHGATSKDPAPRPANLSWITGDEIYLCRVKPSIATMNDRASYEYFAGSGRWTRQLDKAQPVFAWNNRAGCVTATYNAPLKRYFMCVTDGVDTVGRFHTYLLESAVIAGPWRVVTYMQHFGEQAYFVNIPSKFISADGMTLWLMYAANFSNGNKNWNTEHKSNPPGGRYGMCLQEVRLKRA